MMTITNNQIHGFGNYLKKNGLHDISVECYSRDTKNFFDWIEDIKKSKIIHSSEDIYNYLDYLDTHRLLSVNSKRRKLMSLKKFFNFIQKNHFPELLNPAEKVIIPNRDESLPELLSHEQISKLLKCAEQSSNFWYKSSRDPLIISLLCFEGLKAMEIINLCFIHLHFSLNNSDFDITSSNHLNYLAINFNDLINSNKKRLISLNLNQTNSETSDFFNDDFDYIIKINVNGRKTRSITLSSITKLYLKKYLINLTKNTEIINNYEKLKTSYLFPRIIGRQSSVLKNSEPSKPMTRHGIKHFLYSLGKSANIKKLNSELLRHYAIDYLIEKGLTIDQIKSHLGLNQQGNIIKHVLIRK